jgi:hypothetical protein
MRVMADEEQLGLLTLITKSRHVAEQGRVTPQSMQVISTIYCARGNIQ